MELQYPIKTDQIKFVLRRDEGFGPVPVFTVSIDGNGNVEYEGIENVRVKGKHSSKISQVKVLKLFSQTLELGILDLETNYVAETIYSIHDNKIFALDRCGTDLPSSELEIGIGKKRKKIYNNQGAPKRLVEFEELIIKLSGVHVWI
jgi:hypothetical protein